MSFISKSNKYVFFFFKLKFYNKHTLTQRKRLNEKEGGSVGQTAAGTDASLLGGSPSSHLFIVLAVWAVTIVG